MNWLKNFWIWLDYDCPRPIRWLFYLIFALIGLSIFAFVLATLFVIGFIGLYYLPERLQKTEGTFVAAIEMIFFIPSFIALIYGIIFLYLKLSRQL